MLFFLVSRGSCPLWSLFLWIISLLLYINELRLWQLFAQNFMIGMWCVVGWDDGTPPEGVSAVMCVIQAALSLGPEWPPLIGGGGDLVIEILKYLRISAGCESYFLCSHCWWNLQGWAIDSLVSSKQGVETCRGQMEEEEEIVGKHFWILPKSVTFYGLLLGDLDIRQPCSIPSHKK